MWEALKIKELVRLNPKSKLGWLKEIVSIARKYKMVLDIDVEDANRDLYIKVQNVKEL